jgi:hypothetical protein
VIPVVQAGTALGAFSSSVLEVALVGYLVLLPLAHAGLYYNFYGRRSLPQPLQRMLERYTNLFGVIIWRVFSVDLVNFFIRIAVEPRDGPPADAMQTSRMRPDASSRPHRLNHVGEMICLTSLFTTLKYYPSNDGIFRERLLRYTRTIPRAANNVVVFQYVSVVKRLTHFDWLPMAEFRVDVDAASVTERVLDQSFSPRSAHAVSPVHEGATPGSYAPASR